MACIHNNRTRTLGAMLIGMSCGPVGCAHAPLPLSLEQPRSGVVIDKAGHPLSVTVTLERAAGWWPFKTFKHTCDVVTKEEGRYELDLRECLLVPNYTYRLSVVAQGFLPWYQAFEHPFEPPPARIVLTAVYEAAVGPEQDPKMRVPHRPIGPRVPGS